MRMVISLTLREAEQLREMAHQERRRPVDQAAYLVARAVAKWAEEQGTAEPDDATVLDSKDADT